MHLISDARSKDHFPYHHWRYQRISAASRRDLCCIASPPLTAPSAQSIYSNLLASLRLRTAFAPLRRAAEFCACFHIGTASARPGIEDAHASFTGTARMLWCHTEPIAREPSPMNGTISIVSIGLTHPFRICICGRILTDTLSAVHESASVQSGNAA